jgi:cell division protein FtsB
MPQTSSNQSSVPSSSATKLQPFRERRWLVLGIIAASALFVVVFVNNTLRVSKLTQDLERLKKDEQHIIRQNELYRAEIIRLQSPERITAVATSRLGLVPAVSAPERIVPQAATVPK